MTDFQIAFLAHCVQRIVFLSFSTHHVCACWYIWPIFYSPNFSPNLTVSFDTQMHAFNTIIDTHTHTVEMTERRMNARFCCSFDRMVDSFLRFVSFHKDRIFFTKIYIQLYSKNVTFFSIWIRWHKISFELISISRN